MGKTLAPSPTLTVSPSSLPSATVGTAYSQAITATGGFGTNTCALTTGTLPTGITLTGCTLGGTPSAAGASNVTITVTDGSTPGVPAAKAYTLTVNAAVSPPVANAVSQSVAENTGSASATTITLNITGGAATSVTVASAASHGTATASGTSITYLPTAGYNGSDSFTYTATNADGTSAAATATITVTAATLTVSPASLPAATVGTAYSQVITATGGFGSNTCALTTGTLPTGITLTGCTLGGTPSAAGSANITITVTDGSSPGVSSPKAYTLTVNAGAAPAMASATISGVPLTAQVSVSTLTLTEGVAVAPFIPVAGVGGTAPMSYAISPALSAGLSFDQSAGRISGTPTAGWGTTSYTVTVTDAASATATGTFRLSVAPALNTLVVTPAVLAPVRARVQYSQALSVANGVAPYTWTLASGSLPPGLTLSAAGVLTGSPVSTSTFTVQVTDSVGHTGSKVYTLTVTPRPDPTQDASVRGLLTGQALMTQQFAQAQITNISAHMQQLHGGFDACNSGTIQLAERSDSVRNPNRVLAQQINGSSDGKRATSSAQPQEQSPQQSAQGSPSCLAQRLFGGAPLGFWIGGGVQHSSIDSVEKLHTNGVTLGVEGKLSSQWVGGVALGFGSDGAKVDKLGTRIDGSSHSLAAYGTYRLSSLSIDAIVGHGSHSLQNRRWVAVDGVFVAGVRSGASTFGSLAVTKSFHTGGLTVESQLGADYIDSRLSGYAESAETTPTTLALTYNTVGVRSMSLLAGVQGLYDIPVTHGTLTPVLKAEYRHIYDRSGNQSMFYSDVADTVYTATSFGLPNSVWKGEAGLRFGGKSGLRSQVTIGYQRGSSGFSSTSVNASLNATIGGSP